MAESPDPAGQFLPASPKYAEPPTEWMARPGDADRAPKQVQANNYELDLVDDTPDEIGRLTQRIDTARGRGTKVSLEFPSERTIA